MPFDRDEVYKEETVREEARLDERARRDRVVAIAKAEKEKKQQLKKALMNGSLIGFGGYMAYRTILLFWYNAHFFS